MDSINIPNSTRQKVLLLSQDKEEKFESSEPSRNSVRSKFEQCQKIPQEEHDSGKMLDHDQLKMKRCEQRLDSLENKLNTQTSIIELLIEELNASKQQQEQLQMTIT